MPEGPFAGRQERLVAAAADAGCRLDLFIARQLPALSRSQIRRLIDAGHVTIDEHVPKPSLQVTAGTEVIVGIPPPAPSKPSPEPIPLTILYEDADIVVIDKPAGLVVHPGAGHTTGTLVNALLYHVSGLSGIGGEQRPGIVHRLDRGTSGVMVIAKHDAAHRALSKQFHDRLVTKEYVALVWGRLERQQTITTPIGRDPRRRLRMSSRATTARAAVTTVMDAEPLGEVTFVRLVIGTGRTHQIRVHLSEAGHPIVGDSLYGGDRRRAPAAAAPAVRLERPFLHAVRLVFQHPVSQAPLCFEAPLPPDLAEVLATLRASKARSSHLEGPQE